MKPSDPPETANDASESRPPGRRALKGPARWMGLFTVALMGSLVAGELTLRVAAGWLAPAAQRGGDVASGPGEAITILSVGDSHTFGLPLPEEESYPAQLEAVLAERHPGRAFRVVNLGIPGLNSAFVANRLERQIFQLRPQLVIVWVGVNNRWNVVETLNWERPDPWLPLRTTLLDFRLFRLASILWFSRTGHQYDPDARGGWYEGELRPSGHLGKGKALKNPVRGLGRDLERMVELTRGLGIPIIVMGYPLPAAQDANEVIFATAGRLGVAAIDSERALARALADGHTEVELIDHRSGPHPSGLLYGYVVEELRPEVEAALSTWHDLKFDDPLSGDVAPKASRPDDVGPRKTGSSTQAPG